jgi:hypothetical protein
MSVALPPGGDLLSTYYLSRRGDALIYRELLESRAGYSWDGSPEEISIPSSHGIF